MREEDFKKKLTPEQYRILRQKGTEVPFSGKYVEEKAKGMYKCAACGNELFSSDAKFDSGTGWPSFTDAANRKNVELREDTSDGMSRVEVTCKNCGSHLGHVFDDGPADKGGKRYCINSACLELEEAEEDDDEEEEKGDGKRLSKGTSIVQAVIVGLVTAAVAAAAYSGGYYVSSANSAAALAEAKSVVCPVVKEPITVAPKPTPGKTPAASVVSAPAAVVEASTPTPADTASTTSADSSLGTPKSADGTTP